MAEFYDPKTEQPITLDAPEQQTNAVKNKEIALANDALYELVDENGKPVGAFYGKNVVKALQENPNYRLPSWKENATIKYQRENDNLLGAAKTFGMSAVDTAAFGLPSAISDDFADKQQALEDVNPTAGLVGTGVGLVGNVYLTRGAGLEAAGAKAGLAAGKAFGTGLAGKITQGAVSGAVEAAPWAISDGIRYADKPDLLAESLLANIGAGVGLGGLLKGVGHIATSTTDTIGKGVGKLFYGATDPAEVEIKSWFKSLQHTSDAKNQKAFNDFVNRNGKEDIRKLINDYDLKRNLNESFDQYIKRVDDVLAKEGKAFAEILDNASGMQKQDHLDNWVKKFGVDVDNINDANLSKYISEINSNSKAQNIDEVLNNLKLKILDPLENNAASQDVFKSASNKINDIERSLYKNAVAEYEPLIQAVFAKEGKEYSQEAAIKYLKDKNIKVSIKELDAQKANFKKAGKYNAPEANLSSEIGDVLYDSLNTNLDLLAGTSKEFREASRRYRAMKIVESTTEEAQRRFDKNAGLGLLNTISGAGSGAVAAATGIATGSIGLGTITSLLTQYLGGTADKWVRANADRLVSKYGTSPRAMIYGAVEEFTENKLANLSVNLFKTAAKSVSAAKYVALHKLLDENDIDYDKSSGNLESAAYAGIVNSLLEAKQSPTVAKNLVKQLNDPDAEKMITPDKITDYLLKNLPKNPHAGKPFAIDFKPAQTEVNKFLGKYEIAMDPYSVFDKLEDGTITRPQVQTLKELYPAMYNAIGNKITEAGYSGKQLPKNKKHIVNMFLPEVNPGKNIAFYQSSFTRERQQKENESIKVNRKIKIPGSEYNSLQRVTG